MYEQYYGLREKPFSLTPDPEFLFLHPTYQNAMDQVLYGIKRREGFTVIVGDVGAGKTTLCWALLKKLDDKHVRTALVLNPLLNEEDVLRAILQDFGVQPSNNAQVQAIPETGSPDSTWMHGLSTKELIDELNTFLMGGVAKDFFNIVIIDEAQNLSLKALELLRLLSNLETAKQKLLQIIFVGQLEFDQKLKQPELKALKQRISIRYELKPLSKADTVKYINHRLMVARAPGNLCFTRGAFGRIYRYSKGYPRLVNLICDRALLAGYSERTLTIDRKLIRKAIRGLKGSEGFSHAGFAEAIKTSLPVAALVLVAFLVMIFFLASGGMERTPLSFLQSSEPQSVEPAGFEGSKHFGAAVAQPRTPEPAVSIAAKPEPIDANAKSDSNVALKPESHEINEVVSVPALPVGEQRAAESNFFLQVHSLRGQNEADWAAGKLKRLGYPAFVRSQLADGVIQWFVVCVGPFSDPGVVREKAVELRTLQGMSPIIRRYAPSNN